MRKLNRLFNTKILFLLFFIILVFTVNQAFAIYKEEEQEKVLPKQNSLTREGQSSQKLSLALDEGLSRDKHLKPEYAAGELIIKFKDKAGLIIDKKLSTKTLQLFPNQTGFAAINKLNAKHKVKEITPVFKALKEKQLQSGKSAKQVYEETKDKFPKRANRAPKDIEPPQSFQYL